MTVGALILLMSENLIIDLSPDLCFVRQVGLMTDCFAIRISKIKNRMCSVTRGRINFHYLRKITSPARRD